MAAEQIFAYLLAIMFNVSVPSEPLNVTSAKITNTSLVLNWEEPSSPNGILLGYRIFYRNRETTNVYTVNNENNTSTPSTTTEITNLGKLVVKRGNP